ncbi:MAG: ferric reductase-like transmembrane domain-containing protein [Actinobacteria bacterium]|nr:ferric reductase-like transmembrane domain-containing protein [Actinomycetota bacterium]
MSLDSSPVFLVGRRDARVANPVPDTVLFEPGGRITVDRRQADRLAHLGSADDPIYRHPAKGRSRYRADLAALVAGLGAGAAVAAAVMVTWEGRVDVGGWFILGGSVTAMLGTYLALIAILLSSRMPWLEREVGHDRMLVWHRTVGPAALLLILAHVVLSTLGWAAAAGVGPVTEFVTMVLDYEWMMPALASFIIMMALGLSSSRRVRRKMKYESWHVSHMYFYVAIALAYGHAVAFGPMFTDYPLIGTAWMALYVVVFGTVLGFRFLVPIVQSMRLGLVVDDVVEEAPGVVSVYMRGRGLAKMHVKGGQFYAWRFITRDHWWQAHPYSISAGHNPDCLRITVKALGDHSSSLARLKRGTRVFAEGPYGVFTADKRHSNTVVCVAAGVGITPIRAMMDDLPDHADVTLIYRVRAEEDLALRAERSARPTSTYAAPAPSHRWY